MNTTTSRMHCLSTSSADGGAQNLPQWEIEVLGNFSSNGLAVPVCNGARRGRKGVPSGCQACPTPPTCCLCAGTDVGCLRSPGATPKYVNVSIVNLHWHTPSEHTLNGRRPCDEALML